MSMDGNRLGAAMLAAMQSAEQGDTPGDSLTRWEAVGNAIVAEISANATIAPLATTSTPADGPGHVHVPITVIKTGGIS